MLFYSILKYSTHVFIKCSGVKSMTLCFTTHRKNPDKVQILEKCTCVEILQYCPLLIKSSNYMMHNHTM